MLLPAVSQLRACAEITLLGRLPGLSFFRQYVHQTIDMEGSKWHRLFIEQPDNSNGFFIPSVDLVVAFLRDPEGRVENNLKAHLPSSSVHIYPAFPLKEERVHVAFYLAQCLHKAGLSVNPRKSVEDSCSRALIGETVPSMGEGKVLLHPGSGGGEKNHSPDFWLELIKALRKNFNDINELNVLLGPAETNLYGFFKNSLNHGESTILLSPETEKLLSLLKHVTLYIGHDSGITHLSAMLGSPTLALFKNSLVHQWRPLGPRVKVIEDQEGSLDLIGKILNEVREMI